MSGTILDSCAVPLSAVVDLLGLAGVLGAGGGAFSLGSWLLRRRRARRRAARLEEPWQDTAPQPLDQRSAGLDGFGPAGVSMSATGLGVGGRAARGRRWPWSWRRLWKESARPGLAGLAVAVAVGGPVGLLVGVLLAVALQRWLPAERSAADRRREHEDAQLVAQLPLASELLAACLSSSATPAQAAAAVAQTVGGPLGARLSAIASELSLGAPPVLCWGRLGDDCPALAPLARCLVRTSVSGAPPAAPLSGLAVAQRATASRAAHERVRRAGVLATAPLGLCFLPAFVLIGIVPVVMGLAASFAHRI
ncbi:type II secretion system F family protein [Kitasatospora mediocidica]|uniref:type II secretion system F family protein n=1 Tax=Kitasatospora mediocidica TaxID=58352 RepID=UPI0012FA94B7|nr:type II secretion system F family protein [Kitasatospora mediocidica]